MNNNKFYPDVKSSVSFPEIEEEVLKYWQENNIFNKSVENRKSKIGNQNMSLFFMMARLLLMVYLITVTY